MTPPPIPPAELLLSHVQWIRELARHLVADQDLAEDLAQETCVVALQRTPDDATKLRTWLAGVMRNLLRQRVRGDGRRRAREEHRARSEGSESTDHLVERIHVQRDLVEHVLRLHEPYKSAVLLRFFEELPPREIARRLGVPTNTVQSRITRGLAQLRERLDREHGEDRRAWLALILPLTKRLDTASATTLGGIALNTKLVVAAGMIVVAGAAIAFLRDDSTVAPAVLPEDSRIVTPTSPTQVPPGREPGLVTVAETAGREEVAAASPLAPEAIEAAIATVYHVRGRVLDEEGAPVGGIRLDTGEAGTTPPDSIQNVVSGPGGDFAFDTTRSSVRLEAEAPRWVTVRAGVWGSDAAFEPVIVIAPRIDLAGRVIDELGRGLARARVRLELPADFRMRFGEILEATHVRSWGTTTEADGSFSMRNIPAIGGARLLASLDGFETCTTEQPTTDDTGLALVLTRPGAPLVGSLRGQVVHADGRPAPHARVATGLVSTLADEEGRFELGLARAVTAERLIAVTPGFLPGESERPFEPLRTATGETTTGWPEFVVLQLGEPALTLSGKVVDHDGEACRGARVWIEEPRSFGVIGSMPAQVEALLAGVEVPPQALTQTPPTSDGDDFTTVTVPASRVPQNPLWTWAETDAEGRFELTGLLRRGYRLRVLLSGTTRVETSRELRAGQRDVLVQLPAPDVYRKVAGRVLLPGGAPAVGVSISEWVPAIDVSARVYGGTTQFMAVQQGRSTTTDDDGRFVLDDVPRRGARLALRGDGIVPDDIPIDDLENPRGLELAVQVRCQVSVELAEEREEAADTLGVLDGEGEPLYVMILTAGSSDAYTEVPLVDGRSGVVSVPSSARKLVLYRAGEVVEEIGFLPRPGELTLVR